MNPVNGVKRALAILVFTALVLASLPTGLVSAAAANPPLLPSCGLDIALAIETSGGIDNFELDELKAAFQAFAAAFLPATASQIAVVDLDTQATILQPLTSDLALVNIGLDALSNEQDEQHTNWQRVEQINARKSPFPDKDIRKRLAAKKNLKGAEAVKIVESSFRDVNISEFTLNSQKHRKESVSLQDWQ